MTKLNFASFFIVGRRSTGHDRDTLNCEVGRHF
jgi:hypothetical protein